MDRFDRFYIWTEIVGSFICSAVCFSAGIVLPLLWVTTTDLSTPVKGLFPIIIINTLFVFGGIILASIGHCKMSKLQK